jgi:hypothetical protein
MPTILCPFLTHDHVLGVTVPIYLYFNAVVAPYEELFATKVGGFKSPSGRSKKIFYKKIKRCLMRSLTRSAPQKKIFPICGQPLI